MQAYLCRRLKRCACHDQAQVREIKQRHGSTLLCTVVSIVVSLVDSDHEIALGEEGLLDVTSTYLRLRWYPLFQCNLWSGVCVYLAKVRLQGLVAKYISQGYG